MVSAVGHSDLIPSRGEEGLSLAALLRAGDADALAGFRDGRERRVKAYCAAVCSAVKQLLLRAER